MKKVSKDINERLDSLMYNKIQNMLRDQVHLRLRMKIWSQSRNELYSQIEQNILL